MDTQHVRESDMFMHGEDRVVVLVRVPVTVELLFDTEEEATTENVVAALHELINDDLMGPVIAIKHDFGPAMARPHRFTVGDLVIHVDSPGYPMEITKTTWREVEGVQYPTYTVFDPTTNELLADVLDTLDLEAVDEK